MQIQLLLSILSADKPGLVESVSAVIEASGGNWLESRLANLRGKFVGVIWVSIDQTQRENLETKLGKLSKLGITVRVEEDLAHGKGMVRTKICSFSAIGPDRQGIIKELSAAFFDKGINLEELQSNLSSAAYSGDPIFEASGKLSFPESVDLNKLSGKLDEIADKLALDISLELSPDITPAISDQ